MTQPNTDQAASRGESALERPVGRPDPERDDDYWDDDDGPERDTTCKHCHGTGGDPWNDGITPCEFCDGEGYEWWN